MPARLAPTGTGSAAQTLAAGNDPRFVNGAMQTLSVSTSFSVGANTVPGGTTGNVFPTTTINAPAGWFRVLSYQTAGIKRWDFGTAGDTESGGNAGSNFFLNAFDDSGNFLNNLFNAYRASGVFSINNASILAGTIASVSISGSTANTPAAGDNSTALATTEFIGRVTDGIATLSTTGGTTTLTPAQYGTAVLIVSGALTSGAVLIVPNINLFRVLNRTTGNFPVTVKTAAGTGVPVTQGTGNMLVADGANVVMADTDLNNIPVGQVTASTGAFTTISATGTVSGAGFAALLAAPGPVGSTTPSTGAFTTLSASGTVSGAGFTSFLAAPPAIGGATPAAATFTSLSIGPSGSAGSEVVNGPAGSARIRTYYSGTSKRWDVGVNSGSEAGSNLGSDFYWARYNDSGVIIDNPLTINRGSGVVAATNFATTGYSYRSGATGLTAAGTTQATGYIVNRSISVFTTVASGAGATLPNVPPQTLSSSVMVEFTVVNGGANAMLLYPASGLSINALAANTALSVAAGATVRGMQVSTTNYRFA